ncbi:hypothetical protein J6590_039872 [Homalodisca vitripennis]|nr:hypothetical protein J6590_039872 [Homalodisca vitripennis]
MMVSWAFLGFMGFSYSGCYRSETESSNRTRQILENRDWCSLEIERGVKHSLLEENSHGLQQAQKEKWRQRCGGAANRASHNPAALRNNAPRFALSTFRFSHATMMYRQGDAMLLIVRFLFLSFHRSRRSGFRTRRPIGPAGKYDSVLGPFTN